MCLQQDDTNSRSCELLLILPGRNTQYVSGVQRKQSCILHPLTHAHMLISCSSLSPLCILLSVTSLCPHQVSSKLTALFFRDHIVRIITSKSEVIIFLCLRAAFRRNHSGHTLALNPLTRLWHYIRVGCKLCAGAINNVASQATLRTYNSFC